MQNNKIIKRELRKTSQVPYTKRVFCTMEDGSIYSCNLKFEDWKKEEPSDAELETSLSKYLNK